MMQQRLQQPLEKPNGRGLRMSQLPQWLADQTWRPGREDQLVSTGAIYGWIRDLKFPPANIRWGRRRVEWTPEFLLAYREYRRKPEPRMNAAKFAMAREDLWQGDKKEIRRRNQELMESKK